MNPKPKAEVKLMLENADKKSTFFIVRVEKTLSVQVYNYAKGRGLNKSRALRELIEKGLSINKSNNVL